MSAQDHPSKPVGGNFQVPTGLPLSVGGEVEHRVVEVEEVPGPAVGFPGDPRPAYVGKCSCGFHTSAWLSPWWARVVAQDHVGPNGE